MNETETRTIEGPDAYFMNLLGYAMAMGRALYAIETVREGEVGKNSDDFLLRNVREALQAYQSIKDGEYARPIEVRSYTEPTFSNEAVILDEPVL